MTYTYEKLSFPGGRDCNEDSVYVEEIDENSLLAIVADGLGGAGGGDVASRIAVSSIASHFNLPNINSPDVVNEAVLKANAAIIASQTETEHMKTTATVLHVLNEKAVCGHLGDSRLYQFRNDKLIFQTCDHSVSQMAVSVGEITKDEIRNHADRNKVLRALGTEEPIKVEINEISVKGGDCFLLCTDGFWELVLESEMEQDLNLSNNISDWIGRMHCRIKEKLNNKSDNYSAIAIQTN